jgi:hypothetical protein
MMFVISSDLISSKLVALRAYCPKVIQNRPEGRLKPDQFPLNRAFLYGTMNQNSRELIHA